MCENLEKMTLCQLAKEYATHANDAAMKELEKRDLLSMMTYDERMELALDERERSDKQFLLDFAKQKADNLSVKDEWAKGYEVGRQVGFKQGLKEGLPGKVKNEES